MIRFHIFNVKFSRRVQLQKGKGLNVEVTIWMVTKWQRNLKKQIFSLMICGRNRQILFDKYSNMLDLSDDTLINIVTDPSL